MPDEETDKGPGPQAPGEGVERAATTQAGAEPPEEPREEAAEEQAPPSETAGSEERPGHDEKRPRHKHEGKTEAEPFVLPRERRISPLTFVLIIIFALCAVGLIVVLNLRVVRDYFEGDTIFWVLRLGLVLMLLTLIVGVIARELANLKYVERVVGEMMDVNRRLRLLMEAGREIGSTLDLPEILERILTYTSSVTGADIGAVYLWEKADDSLHLALARGVDEKRIMFKELPMKKGLMGSSAVKREMVVLDSTASLDERDNVFFGAVEPASLVLVPLVARGKFLGMLVAANLEEHDYTLDEKRLLDGLGELASMAITNAELYRIARRSLDALSRERGVTDSVLEEMVAGVMTSDAKGRLVIFNREAQRLTGYSFAEKTQVLLRPEASLDKNPLGPLEHGMLEVLDNPSLTREGDALLMKADMSLLPVSYRIYPLMSGAEVVGAACVFMEAHAAAGSGRRDGVDYQVLLRSLGARVERVYTHPLSRVIERMRGMALDDWSRGREDIITLLEAGYSTLLGLLEDLEQYLNCTTTREWDTPAEYDLESMTTEVVRELIATPEAEGVRVSVKLAGLPPAFGFERMIRTALEQVIENAYIAASSGPEKVVEVTGRPEGAFVRLEVRDTGPGLTPEAREFMFMPFFTVWEGRSGLGLSMVKRVMQRLGGRVGAGDAAEGALFFMEFPVSPARRQPGTADESAAEVSG